MNYNATNERKTTNRMRTKPAMFVLCCKSAPQNEITTNSSEKQLNQTQSVESLKIEKENMNKPICWTEINREEPAYVRHRRGHLDDVQLDASKIYPNGIKNVARIIVLGQRSRSCARMSILAVLSSLTADDTIRWNGGGALQHWTPQIHFGRSLSCALISSAIPISRSSASNFG